MEVDQQQITLDRFSLFFPEKRPFFLENAGAFTVSNGRQAASERRARTELFFSRRIGIGPGGREIPILGGARVSGKVSDSVSIGLVNMQTEAVGGVASANNFSVARVRRDLPNRSNIGMLFVNRQATGDLAGTADQNRTYALDGRWGIGQYGQVSGFVSRTQTPGLDGEDHAYNVVGNYDSEAWRLTLGYLEIADNFNPEVGFLGRRGFRNLDVGVSYSFRPQKFWKLQQMRPHGSFSRYWNFERQMETSFLHLDYDWEFNDSSTAKTTTNITGEGVTAPFEIADGVIVPAGVYEHREAAFSYNSNRGAPVNFSIRTTLGGFFGGDRVTWGPGINLRRGDTLNASIRWSRNDITLPGGSFITNLTSTSVTYNFSPRLFAQALVQHNDSADVWSANLRFGLLQQANTGLFIVYNDTRGLHDTMPSGAGRSLILKYSQLFDLIDRVRTVCECVVTTHPVEHPGGRQLVDDRPRWPRPAGDVVAHVPRLLGPWRTPCSPVMSVRPAEGRRRPAYRTPCAASASWTRAPDRIPAMPMLPSWQAYSNSLSWLLDNGTMAVHGLFQVVASLTVMA